eukprot:3141555-Lingulodinium_polyedra.AAC.1
MDVAPMQTGAASGTCSASGNDGDVSEPSDAAAPPAAGKAAGAPPLGDVCPPASKRRADVGPGIIAGLLATA